MPSAVRRQGAFIGAWRHWLGQLPGACMNWLQRKHRNSNVVVWQVRTGSSPYSIYSFRQVQMIQHIGRRQAHMKQNGTAPHHIKSSQHLILYHQSISINMPSCPGRRTSPFLWRGTKSLHFLKAPGHVVMSKVALGNIFLFSKLPKRMGTGFYFFQLPYVMDKCPRGDSAH